MVTQKGDNTYVVGITGNFDDAQTAVKKMFNDRELSAELNERASSFHLQTLSISEDWCHRSYITYTHIQDLLEMEQLKPVKRSM